MIVVGIAGPIDQDDRGRGRAPQLIDKVRFLRELGAIALRKFGKTYRIVIKPAPQFRARTQILIPAFNAQSLFPQSARPQPIDQKPPAFAGDRGVVRATQRDGTIRPPHR